MSHILKIVLRIIIIFDFSMVFARVIIIIRDEGV